MRIPKCHLILLYFCSCYLFLPSATSASLETATTTTTITTITDNGDTIALVTSKDNDAAVATSSTESEFEVSVGIKTFTVEVMKNNNSAPTGPVPADTTTPQSISASEKALASSQPVATVESDHTNPNTDEKSNEISNEIGDDNHQQRVKIGEIVSGDFSARGLNLAADAVAVAQTPTKKPVNIVDFYPSKVEDFKQIIQQSNERLLKQNDQVRLEEEKKIVESTAGAAAVMDLEPIIGDDKSLMVQEKHNGTSNGNIMTTNIEIELIEDPSETTMKTTKEVDFTETLQQNDDTIRKIEETFQVDDLDLRPDIVFESPKPSTTVNTPDTTQSSTSTLSPPTTPQTMTTEITVSSTAETTQDITSTSLPSQEYISKEEPLMLAVTGPLHDVPKKGPVRHESHDSEEIEEPLALPAKSKEASSVDPTPEEEGYLIPSPSFVDSKPVEVQAPVVIPEVEKIEPPVNVPQKKEFNPKKSTTVKLPQNVEIVAESLAPEKGSQKPVLKPPKKVPANVGEFIPRRIKKNDPKISVLDRATLKRIDFANTKFKSHVGNDETSRHTKFELSTTKFYNSKELPDKAAVGVSSPAVTIENNTDARILTADATAIKANGVEGNELNKKNSVFGKNHADDDGGVNHQEEAAATTATTTSVSDGSTLIKQMPLTNSNQQEKQRLQTSVSGRKVFVAGTRRLDGKNGKSTARELKVTAITGTTKPDVITFSNAENEKTTEQTTTVVSVVSTQKQSVVVSSLTTSLEAGATHMTNFLDTDSTQPPPSSSTTRDVSEASTDNGQKQHTHINTPIVNLVDSGSSASANATTTKKSNTDVNIGSGNDGGHNGDLEVRYPLPYPLYHGSVVIRPPPAPPQVRTLSRLQEKINALDCELPNLPADSTAWRGNETHELHLPIKVSGKFNFLYFFFRFFRLCAFFCALHHVQTCFSKHMKNQ